MVMVVGGAVSGSAGGEVIVLWLIAMVSVVRAPLLW